MKRTKLILVLLSILMIVSSCGKSQSEDDIALAEGTYVLADVDDNTMEIVLDPTNESFSIRVLDHDFITGEFEVEEGRLKAKSDDGRFEYVFEIEDDQTLRFISEESDTLIAVNGDSDELELSDGIKFVHVDS